MDRFDRFAGERPKPLPCTEPTRRPREAAGRARAQPARTPSTRRSKRTAARCEGWSSQ